MRCSSFLEAAAHRLEFSAQQLFVAEEGAAEEVEEVPGLVHCKVVLKRRPLGVEALEQLEVASERLSQLLAVDLLALQVLPGVLLASQVLLDLREQLLELSL